MNLNIKAIEKLKKSKIVLLGGTGYLGTALYDVLSTYIKYVFAFSSKLYNSEIYSDNNKLCKFIKTLNITLIYDFSRNTCKSAISYFLLEQKFPDKLIYVNISSYCVMYPKIFANDNDYICAKKLIENSKRKNNYSIRLPRITSNMENEILQLKNDIDLLTCYCYVSSLSNFIETAINIIAEPYGIYVMQSSKIYI